MSCRPVHHESQLLSTLSSSLPVHLPCLVLPWTFKGTRYNFQCPKPYFPLQPLPCLLCSDLPLTDRLPGRGLSWGGSAQSHRRTLRSLAVMLIVSDASVLTDSTPHWSLDSALSISQSYRVEVGHALQVLHGFHLPVFFSCSLSSCFYSSQSHIWVLGFTGVNSLAASPHLPIRESVPSNLHSLHPSVIRVGLQMTAVRLMTTDVHSDICLCLELTAPIIVEFGVYSVF